MLIKISSISYFIGRVCTKDNTVTALYAKACVEAAKESGCRSVDMYTEMMKEKVLSQY